MCDLLTDPYVEQLRAERRSREAVPDCPQPDYPLRERAYTEEQLAAMAVA